MNYSEITFKGLLCAVKRQWKILLLSVILFAVAGVVAGVFYADDLSATAAGSADEIWTADFGLLIYDEEYYNTCRTELISIYNNAESYLATLTSAVVDPMQREKLQELQKCLEEINSECLDPIQDAFGGATALYFPEDFYSEIVKKYEDLEEKTRYNLIVSAEAAELIKNMQIPTNQTENFNKTYEALLSQAANYGAYQKNQEIYRQILDRLDREAVRIRSDSRAMESNLNAAAEQLNVVVDEINEMAEQIAQTENLNIIVAYPATAKHGANNSAEIQTLHTHGEQTEQEVFLILTIFCILCGVCVGTFLAICCEVKSKKKHTKQVE